MARQSTANKKKEAPVAENTPEVTEATEAPTEAPQESTSTENTESAPVDLGPFQKVVAEVTEHRDSTTGVVPSEELTKVTAAYNELDANGKRASKKWAQEEMMKAVQALDGPLARAYSLVTESLVATGKSGSTSTPADPTGAFVNRVVALHLAVNELTGNVPERVSEDWSERVGKLITELSEQVATYRTWLNTEPAEGAEKPDAPEVNPVVKQAFKLATGRGGVGKASAPSGPRADIGKHIIEAFAEHPSGHTLKVSEIANFKSSEYPNGNASQGAVSARLFPKSGKCTVEGIEPIEKDGDNPRRARKI